MDHLDLKPQMVGSASPKQFEPFKVAALGGMSGMLMEVILHPLDTVRTRTKANVERFISTTKMVRHMYKTQGLKSYFQGFSCTSAGSLIANSVYFYLYESSKHSFKEHQYLPKEARPFISAFFAGLITDIIYIPFDVVRTRMQIDKTLYGYKHVFHGMAKMVSKEGLGSLYLGGPTLVALDIINTSLTFGFYEMFFERLKAIEKSRHPSQSSFVGEIEMSVISSIVSAGTAALLTTPLDVMVTRLQMQNTANEEKLNFTRCLNSIYNREGLSGFMKGCSGRVLYYSLAALILFPTYEVLKKTFDIDLSK